MPCKSSTPSPATSGACSLRSGTDHHERDADDAERDDAPQRRCRRSRTAVTARSAAPVRDRVRARCARSGRRTSARAPRMSRPSAGATVTSSRGPTPYRVTRPGRRPPRTQQRRWAARAPTATARSPPATPMSVRTLIVNSARDGPARRGTEEHQLGGGEEDQRDRDGDADADRGGPVDRRTRRRPKRHDPDRRRDPEGDRPPRSPARSTRCRRPGGRSAARRSRRARPRDRRRRGPPRGRATGAARAAPHRRPRGRGETPWSGSCGRLRRRSRRWSSRPAVSHRRALIPVGDPTRRRVPRP